MLGQALAPLTAPIACGSDAYKMTHSAHHEEKSQCFAQAGNLRSAFAGNRDIKLANSHACHEIRREIG
jgi:hypothetical protein